MCIDIVIGRFLLFSIFKNSLSFSGENTWEGLIYYWVIHPFLKTRKSEECFNMEWT